MVRQAVNVLHAAVPTGSKRHGISSGAGAVLALCFGSPDLGISSNTCPSELLL